MIFDCPHGLRVNGLVQNKVEGGGGWVQIAHGWAACTGGTTKPPGYTVEIIQQGMEFFVKRGPLVPVRIRFFDLCGLLRHNRLLIQGGESTDFYKKYVSGLPISLFQPPLFDLHKFEYGS